MPKLSREEIENIFSLTPMQEGILFHYLSEPEGDCYVEQLSLEMSGKLIKRFFEQAWNFVIEQNEMLRTLFRWENSKRPVQLTLKRYELKPRYYDLSKGAKKTLQRRLEILQESDRNERFDLRNVPFRITLARLTEDRHMLIISHHHILYDGWSNGIILYEFLTAYNDLCRGSKLASPTKAKFKEYVKWVRSRDQESQASYWREYLAGYDSPTELPIKQSGRAVKSTICCLNSRIDDDFRLELEHFCGKNKITPAALFYCAYGILLQKYNDSRDGLFGATVSGRSARIDGIENMVGLFINTLPMRVPGDPGESSINLLKMINRVLQIREAHETTPLTVIKGSSRLQPHEELFDSIMVIENYPLHKEPSRGENRLTLRPYSMFSMTNYDLTIAVSFMGGIEIRYIYAGERFFQDAIERLDAHLVNILKDLPGNPDKRLGDIEILTEVEKERLLRDSSGPATDFPASITILHMFARQVRQIPHHVAVTGPEFTREEKTTSYEQHLTYQELDFQSDVLGRCLSEKGVEPGNLVGIMLERSLDMIIGLTAILKTGGVYLPIDPDYPKRRIRLMVEDSRVSHVVSRRIFSERISSEPVGIETVYLEDEMVFDPGRLKNSRNLHDLEFTKTAFAEHLLYLIYTSGSTGRPKGVLVKQRGFVNLVYCRRAVFGENRRSRSSQVASPGFDAMAAEVWPCLSWGGGLCIAGNEIRPDPAGMKEWLIKMGITISFQPTIIAEKLLMEEWLEQGVALKALLAAGDRLTMFPAGKYPFKLYNLYGPTEDTVWSTWAEVVTVPDGSALRGTNPPIGKPIGNHRVYIVRSDSYLQPVGLPGELCIAGEGMACGYLNRVEMTADRFVDIPVDTGTSARIYRTGDLARWGSGGNLEFLGRLDRQVKIRGYRIELGEIENLLLNDKSIKEAVVRALDRRQGSSNEKFLCAYVVSDPKDALSGGNETGRAGLANGARLREYLAKTLPAYMIPSHFMEVESIPLTSNGKIDVKALPVPAVGEMDLEFIPPRNETEKRLADIWAEVLEIDRGIIGIDSDFFHLGGHSLKVITMVAMIHKVCHVRLALSWVLQSLTLRKLAQIIRSARWEQFTDIRIAEKRDYFAVSSAQKRLFILHQVDAGSTRYNISGVLRYPGILEKSRVEEAFGKIVRRHESLRTSFEVVGEEPVQRIRTEAHFKLEYFPLFDKRQVIQHFFRPFNLSRTPLLRIGLIDTAEGDSILLFDMHHIISDEASLERLEKEFWTYYNGGELPAVRIQYRDFSQWQNRLWESPSMKTQAEYWLGQFNETIPVLRLPVDYPRPAVTKAEGSRISFAIGEEVTAWAAKLVRETGATMFMLLAAVYSILLSKYSGQEEIVVGSPVLGRRHPDLEDIIGLFANILPIRYRLSGQTIFTDFLLEVKERIAAALENQEYPFEKLVWNLKLTLNPGRNPLFDVVAVWRSTTAGNMKEEIVQPKIHNELILVAAPTGDALSMVMQYSTELFKKTTVEKMGRHYVEILTQVLECPDIRLADIRISHGLMTAQQVNPQYPDQEHRDFRF